MLPEEREDLPLGGGRAQKRGAIAVARSLSPIASAILLALIAVLLGIVVRQGEHTTLKAGVCDFTLPIPAQPPFAPHSPVLLSNGLVWLGVGVGLQPNTDILLVDGKIAQIGTKIAPPPGAVVLNLNNAVVTPGVVDLHSHAGVYSFPSDIVALSDGNEMTNPVFPQVRAIDAFDPQDFAIPWIRQGGTTAAQVLPGSGNVMGGEAVHIKYRISTTVQDLLLLGGPPAEKMATGENPKHTYGPRGQTPMSRMGTAWLIRQQFEAAQQLQQAQEAWCAGGKQGPMPTDLALEPLLEILRGQRTLNIHSYEVVDMEACIRIAQEFGFKIGAFHHALEAWMIPDVIKANNITIATFTDLWGFKWEGYDASVYAPQVLSDAGVKTVLKSDHPVTDSHYLMWMAAKAVHYNMKPDLALAAVTSVPAAAIGYAERIGSLKVGLDADVVVWDRHPLLLGAKPNYVFIEGQTVYTNPTPSWGATSLPTVVSKLVVANGASPVPNTVASLSSYTIQGATVWHMQSNAPLSGANVVVQNGIVQCVGLPADCPAGAANVFQVQGTGIAPTVTPGFIESDTWLGQSDIDQEPITQDGVLETDGDTLYASDGIAIQSKHVTAALKGGVTVSVNAPLGANVIGGFGVAWKLAAVTLTDGLVQDPVGLHVSIGQQAKSGGPYAAVSGQISTLRTRLQAAQAEIATNPPAPSAFARVLLGQVPLVAHVYNADYIASLLRLQSAFGNFSMVLVGASEGWVVASAIAAANVSVIVSPPLCVPMEFFAAQRCQNNNAALMAAAGVRVGISTGNYENSRHIRWEAGWQAEYGLSYYDALAAVTSNVADAFGLGGTGIGRIIPGTEANFVLWDQDPLTLGSSPQLVAVGTSVQIQPRQF